MAFLQPTPNQHMPITFEGQKLSSAVGLSSFGEGLVNLTWFRRSPELNFPSLSHTAKSKLVLMRPFIALEILCSSTAGVRSAKGAY